MHDPITAQGRGWSENHPVLELLRQRRARKSKSGRREDSHKLGLAVDGAGMRGIISAGMLIALEDLGFTNAFDCIYGVSAGAINAAYFLTGDMWYALSIYYDDLPIRQSLNIRRLLQRRAILGLDYAFDVVVDGMKPLNYNAVLSSQIPLNVAVTFVDTLEPASISAFKSKEDLKSALMASGWLPVATHGTITLRGRPAVDGRVLLAHPFRLAVEDGCTHVLSLSTRPLALRRRSLTPLQQYAAWRMGRVHPGLGTAHIKAIRTDTTVAAFRLSGRLAQDQRPWIVDLAPLPGTPEINRFERDRGRLLEGARHSYEVVVLALERRHVRVVPQLTIPNQDFG